MQISTPALTPTAIANLTYCERLFYISKNYPEFHSVTTFPLVWGSLEHETFRILADKFDLSWRKDPNKLLKTASQDDVTTTLDHVYNLAVESHPQFADDIKRTLPELHYRLNQWIDLKQIDLNRLIHDGFSRDHGISSILPWKCEDKVYSNIYGIYGRVDAIYSDGQCLIPEDIKTHGSRFSSFIHQESHIAQLICYCIMLEEKYNMPSLIARILYSKDITYVNVKASLKVKKSLINKIELARNILDQEIPPLLQGEEAMKCKHCYARNQCFKIAKEQENFKMIEKFIDPATIPTKSEEKENGN